MITLYQFVISHYCEKVRWALDYKGLEYKIVNVIPGPHFFQIKRFAPGSSLPVIRDGNNIVQDSTFIIDYLDRVYPQKLLTPKDEKLKREILEWEEFCDNEIGVHLRRFFYNTLLKDPPMVIRMFVQDGPWYAPIFYKLFFPVVKKIMIKAMNINEETAKRSEERLVKGMERVNQRVRDHKYLVGDSLTRADITAASLLAPLCRPPEHQLKWPTQLPDMAEKFLDAHGKEPLFNWVLEKYKTERG